MPRAGFSFREFMARDHTQRVTKRTWILRRGDSRDWKSGWKNFQQLENFAGDNFRSRMKNLISLFTILAAVYIGGAAHPEH